MTPAEVKARYWNVWWTLTVLAAGFTIAVAVLEYLGFFSDLGIALGFAGVVLTVLFGLSASTRSSVHAVRADIASVRGALGQMRDTLIRIEQLLLERLRPIQP